MSTEPDGIPLEVLKALGEKGSDSDVRCGGNKKKKKNNSRNQVRSI